MVRSAAAVLALSILPGFIAAQQTQTQPVTHTVVKGDCLWNLATTYYQNPWDWRRIWNANKDKIEDPNLIYPGQVFLIPGKEEAAQVTGVSVQPAQGAQQAEQQQAEEQQAAAAAAPSPSSRNAHTVFYKDSSIVQSGVPGELQAHLLAVSRGQVYAAPWLVPGAETVPAHLGVLTGRSDLPDPSETLRSYERVKLDLPGATPSVGDQYLLYRVTETLPQVGQVVSPTGTVTVTDVGDDGVTGVIMAEYGRILPGDFVGPLPEYGLERGAVAHAVANGPQAMIMGMAMPEAVANLNAIAFLDLGSDDGVAVGDEFELRDWSSTGNVVEGRLQVVSVKDRTSSARVVNMRDDVFHQGVVVRLAKKMD